MLISRHKITFSMSSTTSYPSRLCSIPIDANLAVGKQSVLMLDTACRNGAKKSNSTPSVRLQIPYTIQFWYFIHISVYICTGLYICVMSFTIRNTTKKITHTRRKICQSHWKFTNWGMFIIISSNRKKKARDQWWKHWHTPCTSICSRHWHLWTTNPVCCYHEPVT